MTAILTLLGIGFATMFLLWLCVVAWKVFLWAFPYVFWAGVLGILVISVVGGML